MLIWDSFAKQYDLLNIYKLKMFDNLALRGFLSLLGAFMISLAVGINFLWGIITIYGTSYFRLIMKRDSLTEDQTDIVFPLMLLGQAISIPFVTRYAKKVSPGMTCFVAGICMSFIMYLASYTQSFSNFALIFGLGNGIILGILYILPIGHCYQYFPRRKTTISFIIIAASGIGTLIFTLIALDCMNPENLSLQEAGRYLYYGKDIAEKFPDYLKILSGVTLGFVSGGGLLLLQYPSKMQLAMKQQMLAGQKKNKKMAGLMNLQFLLDMQDMKQSHKNPFGNADYELVDISRNYDKNQSAKVYGDKGGQQKFWNPLDESFMSYEPPKENEDDLGDKKVDEGKEEQNLELINQCPRTSDGPRECIFWLVFLIIVLGANFGQMISVNYKTYMKRDIQDDRYLSMVGAFGAIACSLSRLIWGSILEKETFKIIYYCLAILNGILAFSIVYISHIKEAYLVYVILSYVVYGGHLGIFPAVASQIFGMRYGPQIYGILFFAFPASNFIQFMLVNYVQQGYEVIFQVSGAMSIGALFLVKKLDLTYDWSERIREHNERKRMLAR